MLAGLKLFVLSGGWVGIAYALSRFAPQIAKVRKDAPLSTGVASALGVLGTLSIFNDAAKQWPLVTVPSSIGLAVFLLAIKFPLVAALVEEHWDVALIVPFVLGYSASKFNSPGAHNKFAGWLFLVIAMLYTAYPLIPSWDEVKELVKRDSIDLTVIPNDNSARVTIPPRGAIWFTEKYAAGLFSMRIVGSGAVAISCYETPGTKENHTNQPVDVYLSACGNQVVRVSVLVTRL